MNLTPTPSLSATAAGGRVETVAPAAPWWRHFWVWMVIGGPAAVVVAGFITLYLAVSGADTLVSSDYYREGVQINETLARRKAATAEEANAMAPAIQGRNHAATGVPVKP